MSDTDVLRVAVVGVGHLGRHHARILCEMPDVRMVGIFDLNRQRAREIAAACGTEMLTDLAQLPGMVDAVTVAVPTDSHLSVAQPLIEAGIPVLIEKPLARSVPETDVLLAAARARGVTLAVGHTERFNPAVVAARQHIRVPRFVEVHRLGTFPERSLDIDVVFDLMIHDLDIVLSIVSSDVVAVEAVGVAVLTPKPDIANARLRFASGCIANVTASRISKDRVRKIRIFQRDSYLSIDYAAQEVERWRLVRKDGTRPVIDGGKLEVPREEPLKRELADFVAAVRERRSPAVSGADGMRALELAQRSSSAMESAR